VELASSFSPNWDGADSAFYTLEIVK